MKIKTFISTASIFIISITCGFSQQIFPAPLDIDTSFGVNGSAITNLIPDQNGDAYHISTGVNINNKVVTLTGIDLFNTNQKVYALVGLDEQGNLDPGFGVGGIIILWHLIHHQAHEMVVRDNGTMIIVGRANIHTNGSKDVFAAQYLANGMLDTSFGINGLTTIQNLNQMVGFNIQVATQSTGSTILAGGNEDITMLRLTSNGSVDSTFGDNSQIIITDLNERESVLDMEVDDQDRIVIVGDQSDKNSAHKAFVARYTSNGVLDKNSFSHLSWPHSSRGYTLLDVYQTHPNLTEGNFANSHLQMDVAVNKPHGSSAYNKIVVSGSFGIVRLNDNGYIDTTFNGNGRIQNNLQFVNSSTPGHIYVEIRGDGKIASLNNQSSTLALYNQDGELALDCTGSYFTEIPNQQTITPIVNFHSLNYSMKIDSNNQIVFAGAAVVPDENFKQDSKAVFVERHQGNCRPRFHLEKYQNIRDVNPFVNPQDIVGPNWKIRY